MILASHGGTDHLDLLSDRKAHVSNGLIQALQQNGIPQIVVRDQPRVASPMRQPESNRFWKAKFAKLHRSRMVGLDRAATPLMSSSSRFAKSS
jgi:hypothetical protein